MDKNEIYCELLVTRCRRGDRNAFQELVRLFERRLVYYLVRLTSNEQEAWDILQQTWIKVFRGLKSVRDTRRFTPWLYTIARRTAIDRIRKLSRESECMAQNDNWENVSAEDAEIEQFADAQLVHYGLGKLPLLHREILSLHFLEQFTIPEITEILELPEGTVKSRLHRAKQALKKILLKEGVASGQ